VHVGSSLPMSVSDQTDPEQANTYSTTTNCGDFFILLYTSVSLCDTQFRICIISVPHAPARRRAPTRDVKTRFRTLCIKAEPCDYSNAGIWIRSVLRHSRMICQLLHR
jgi:hypothetical protein